MFTKKLNKLWRKLWVQHDAWCYKNPAGSWEDGHRPPTWIPTINWWFCLLPKRCVFCWSKTMNINKPWKKDPVIKQPRFLMESRKGFSSWRIHCRIQGGTFDLLLFWNQEFRRKTKCYRFLKQRNRGAKTKRIFKPKQRTLVCYYS